MKLVPMTVAFDTASIVSLRPEPGERVEGERDIRVDMLHIEHVRVWAHQRPRVCWLARTRALDGQYEELHMWIARDDGNALVQCAPPPELDPESLVKAAGDFLGCNAKPGGERV